MEQLQSFQVPCVDGPTLHVRQWGTGKLPCVLIHGSGDGGYVWDDFCRSLPLLYRALAIDLRGHGHSQWSSDKRYDIASYVADVERVMHVLELERFALVGHSLGADIAVRVAAAHADRIPALVIVDFGPDLNTEAIAQSRANMKESLRIYPAVSDYVAWLASTRPLASPLLLQHWASSALEGVPGGGLRLSVDPAAVDTDHYSNCSCENERVWALLERIVCPTLVVRGAGSAVLRRAVAERMMHVLHDATLHTVPNAGHAVMLDHPDEFNRAVGGFLMNICGRN